MRRTGPESSRLLPHTVVGLIWQNLKSAFWDTMPDRRILDNGIHYLKLVVSAYH
jgi:hypothetical protein